MRRLPRAAAVAVLTLGSFGALAACGSDEPSESAIEKAIEDNTSGDVDVDIDDDKVKIETDEGTVTSGMGLPEGFPEDDVPLADGTIQSGVNAQGEGFLVTVEYDGSAEEARAAAGRELEGAGFDKQPDNPAGDAYTSDKWQVLVFAVSAGGKTMLSYTLGPVG